MGNSIDKEVVNACKAFDFKRLQDVFLSKEGQNFDVFKIIFTYEQNYHLDCISLLLTHQKQSTPLLPFLELIKKQIEKNNKGKDIQSKPQFDKLDRPYIERLVEKSTNIDEFNFFLDNDDIIPLRDESSDKNGCSSLLHLLCEKSNRANLLKEYLSSGKVENCFKNSDNDGKQMRHSYKYDRQTPIQLACRNFNVEAVRELIVNNTGGANLAESIETMLANASEALKHEDAAVDICLCILSQPNAGEIRNRVVQNEALLKATCCERNPRTHHRNHNTARSKLLQIEIRHNFPIQLATAAFVIGLDKVYECLINNGCQAQTQKLRITHTGIIIDQAKAPNAEKVREILITLRAHEICIDFKYGCPLLRSCNRCNVEIVDMLLAAGSDANECTDARTRSTESPLTYALTFYADLPPIPDSDRIAVMKSLINHGANVNCTDQYKQTPSHLIVTAPNFGQQVLNSFLELAKDCKKIVDANILNNRGNTALHEAIEQRKPHFVEALLPITDPDAKNRNGKTPKDLVVEFLQDGKARDTQAGKMRELFGI